MLNIDRVREMDSKELTKLINETPCNYCTYKDKDCGSEMCSIGVDEWLNQDTDLTFGDIEKEHNEFCRGKVCEMCKYSHKTCQYEYFSDNFKVIDGKITRIQK